MAKTMSMRRSSPPRSNSNDRSHVGWKLRERYLRRNHQGVPTALYNHPEDTSSVRSTRSADETGPLGRSARRFRSRGFSSNNNNNNNERTTTSSSSSSLGGRRGIPNRTRSLGNRGGGGIGGLDSSSVHSSSSRSSARSRYSVRSAGQRLGGGTIDPNLPPAFRVAHRIEQQRRRVKAQRDDVSCLGSVASHCSTTANSTASGWDDSDDDDDDSSIDSADSFGAFGSDDDDDGDAARESRTQLAKANHEVQQQGSNRRRSDTLKKASRFPRMNNTRGALGIPLDLIIEENGSNHKG